MVAAGAEQALELVVREEWGRCVAALIRRTGDWDLAEECVQDACAEALRVWPRAGVPLRPGAWLTRVAANRAVDRLRRARRGAELLEAVARDPLRSEVGGGDAAASGEMSSGEDASSVEDDRLRLIFTCCHPALALEARVALTLRMLGGLSTAEVARALLVSEPTMAKRLTRAKAKIAAARIPYRVPDPDALPERLGGVLGVLYLMFNEGYASASPDGPIRGELTAEAIRLGALLRALMPEEPETAGVLALMLLQDSRREARLDADGGLVVLDDQDRARWDRAQIDEALSLLEAIATVEAVGPYQLQAEIAACHARAPTVAETDWARIAALYGLLARAVDSPVVALNRAVAVAMAGDPDGALRALDDLTAGSSLANYHLLEASRADILRRSGRTVEAASAYQRALSLADSETDRRHLRRRLSELSAG